MARAAEGLLGVSQGLKERELQGHLRIYGIEGEAGREEEGRTRITESSRRRIAVLVVVQCVKLTHLGMDILAALLHLWLFLVGAAQARAICTRSGSGSLNHSTTRLFCVFSVDWVCGTAIGSHIYLLLKHWPLHLSIHDWHPPFKKQQ